jgi:hypothetical protein
MDSFDRLVKPADSFSEKGRVKAYDYIIDIEFIYELQAMV